MHQFFASNKIHVPSFMYAGDKSQRHYNPRVDAKYIDQAERILRRSKGFSAANELKLNHTQFKAKLLEYLSLLGLEDLVDVETSPSAVSVACVSRSLSGQSKHKIFISPLPVSASIVESVCAHEIGTHLLRMLNDEHQVWGNKKIQRRYFTLKPHFDTEVGLACLNGLLFNQEDCFSLYNAALRYIAVVVAHKSDFQTLFVFLSNYISDEQECFRFCARAKRSLNGVGNDQSYLIGALDILQHINTTDFVALYAGLIDREDSLRLKNLLRLEAVRLPPFLQSRDLLRDYTKSLQDIAEANGIGVFAVERPISLKSLRRLSRSRIEKSKKVLKSSSRKLLLYA